MLCCPWAYLLLAAASPHRGSGSRVFHRLRDLAPALISRRLEHHLLFVHGTIPQQTGETQPPSHPPFCSWGGGCASVDDFQSESVSTSPETLCSSIPFHKVLAPMAPPLRLAYSRPPLLPIFSDPTTTSLRSRWMTALAPLGTFTHRIPIWERRKGYGTTHSPVVLDKVHIPQHAPLTWVRQGTS